jgi:hypothetical protein
LEIIRTLAASVNSPPPEQVEKWYRRLDQWAQTAPPAEIAKVREVFLAERLILTNEGSWAESGEVYASISDDDIPDVATIRPSVQELTLWRRLGVADRPAIDLVIQWLNELPSGHKLADDRLQRVVAITSRYPHKIWNDCGHWPNLVGEWLRIENFRFSETRSSESDYHHLFETVLKKTANFSRLPVEALVSEPFSKLTPLLTGLEERIDPSITPAKDVKNSTWLATFGQCVSRIKDRDPGIEERIRNLGFRLAKTAWITASSLRVIPFLGGTQAGTPKSVEATWHEELLVTLALPTPRLARLVPDLLGKTFGRPDISSAASYCFGRPSAEIDDYFRENFKLSDVTETLTEDLQHPLPPSDKIISPPDNIVDRVKGGQDNSPRAEDGSSVLGKLQTEKRSSPEASTKIPLIERYALAHGFRKVSKILYRDQKGRSITLMPHSDSIWMFEGGDGTDQMHYWVADEYFDDANTLIVPSEIWTQVTERPSAFAFILSHQDGSPNFIPGTDIAARWEHRKIVAYDATYRLVTFDDQ